jgi:hypothetical protein
MYDNQTCSRLRIEGLRTNLKFLGILSCTENNQEN